jgi:uncharacterized NAD(P)/FAD-binding protein YdhS
MWTKFARLVLCRGFGSHHEEPVTATARRGHYVLLRCTRCPAERALIGTQAEQWIAQYLRAG